jgi:UDP-N-acetyl-D-galactosamine dehydrogenase
MLRNSDGRSTVIPSIPEPAAWVEAFYDWIIVAATNRDPSLKLAEAAKVIENIQRNLNISLVNELVLIFRQVGIDMLDVLEAVEILSRELTIVMIAHRLTTVARCDRVTRI